MKKTIIALLALSAAVCAYAQGPRVPTVSDYPQAHDPVVAFCEGRYYVFTTGYNIGVMSSDDMKNWRTEPAALKETPKWALDRVPGYKGHTWAPDILYHNGTWYLYYSCSSFGKNSSAIGVATNTTLNPENPAYEWVDHGMLIESIPGQTNWNAIDPNAVIDENGQGWLCFGSFWSGIKLVKLNPDLTSLANPGEIIPLCERKTNGGAVEAPFIYKKLGWYYLFVSYDYCCRGEKSDYKVVVGRSKNVEGPYLDKNGVSLLDGGGTLVVEGNARYAGAGHSATVDFDGWDYLFFHGYDTTDAGRSHLLIREINWDADDWPSVEL